MTKSPSISVIMPVYNAGKYVKKAIQSILEQTFSDFEFIIINDCSTDESLNIIRSFKDKRIILLNNPLNLGNYPSRNKGLSLAKGKYICVMDADDTAMPNRFERQYLFMEENPEIGLAGSGFRFLGREQNIYRENDYEKIKVILLRNNCFIHPTLIIRYDYIKKYNLQYNEKYYFAADYDLIVRAARFFHITNMPEILLNYRIHDNQITKKSRQKQMEYAEEISIEQLKYIDIDPDEAEVDLYIKLLKGIPINYSQNLVLHKWIAKLLKVNFNIKYYKEDELRSFFNSLLSMQSSYNVSVKLKMSVAFKKQDKRFDLTDTTFLIRLRIDSLQRVENVDAAIRFLKSNFKTIISIVEVDSEQHYFPGRQYGDIRYRFVVDKNEIFHKTIWANQMISEADTPYLAIWDADAICAPEQVVEAVNKLRNGKAIMSFPYDGRFYSCDQISSDLYKKTFDIKVLEIYNPIMPLMHGYHSSGGAFFVDKVKYIAAGGENENIYGWGLEDAERLKRMESLCLKVYYSKGPTYHLWHPKGKNSIFASNVNEIRNRNEFLRTCSITN